MSKEKEMLVLIFPGLNIRCYCPYYIDSYFNFEKPDFAAEIGTVSIETLTLLFSIDVLIIGQNIPLNFAGTKK